MHHIKHLVFWLGGVLVPRVWRLTRDALAASGAEYTPELCFMLMDQEIALAAGSITPDEFCAQAVGAAGIELPPDRLNRHIRQGIEPLPGILSVVDALAARHSLRLLSDFPPEWLSVALQDTALSRYFMSDSIVMISDLDLETVGADLPKKLIRAGLLIPGRSLLVADDPILTENALRAKLDAIIFVDASRLRKELSLLRLLSSNPIT